MPLICWSLFAHAIPSVWGRLVIRRATLRAESRQQDLEYLKLKVDNGAEFILTNYFY